jgi:hypothetical protein
MRTVGRDPERDPVAEASAAEADTQPMPAGPDDPPTEFLDRARTARAAGARCFVFFTALQCAGVE